MNLMTTSVLVELSVTVTFKRDDFDWLIKICI